MITVQSWPVPFCAWERTTDKVSHVAGLTVGELASEKWTRLSGFHSSRNGVEVPLTERVQDGDFVDFWFMPEDPPTLIALAKFAVGLVVAAGFSYLIQAILPTPEGPKERDDERSPTYGFSRITNVRSEGQPIPVVYGEHLVGGTIINEFIEVDNTDGTSDYYGQVAFSQGTVKAIAGKNSDTEGTAPITSGRITSGMFVNDNAISNFEGVKVWMRLGANEQEGIPGFSEAKTVHEVGADLLQEETPDTNNSELVIPIESYASDTAPHQAIWDEFAFGFDTPTACDRIDIIFAFPSGLYGLSEGGDLQPAFFTYFIRYSRIDSAGVPLLGFGFGGNNNDGWIYEAPRPTVTAEHQGAFQNQTSFVLRDPQTAVTLVPGEALTVGVGGQGYAQTTGFFVPSDSMLALGIDSTAVSGVENSVLQYFSIEGWVKIHTEGDIPIFEWSTDTVGDIGHMSNGIWVGLIPGTGGFEGDTFFSLVGHSGVAFTYQMAGVDMADLLDEWHHFAISFTAQGDAFVIGPASSANNHTHFFWDSVYQGQVFNFCELRIPDRVVGPAKATIGWSQGKRVSGVHAERQAHATFDEIHIYDTPLSVSEINARYNNGIGQHLAVGANLVASYPFDFESLASQQFLYPNHLELVGTGLPTSAFLTTNADGLVGAVPSGQQSRDTYRIQILRVNKISSSVRVADDVVWQLTNTIIDEQFVYPNIAYYSVILNASEQLNTSTPKLSAVVKGKELQVWNGSSFTEEFSSNPAWVALDIATNPRYGGGSVWDKDTDVDLQSVLDLAGHCATTVYDGLGRLDVFRQTYNGSANEIPIGGQLDMRLLADGGSDFWFLEGGQTNIIIDPDVPPVSPFGTLTADRVRRPTSGAGNHYLSSRSLTLVDPSDGPWVLSFYVARDFAAGIGEENFKFHTSVEVRRAGTLIFVGVFNAGFGRINAGVGLNLNVDPAGDFWRVSTIPITLTTGLDEDVNLRVRPVSALGDTDQNDYGVVFWGWLFERGQVPSNYDPGLAAATVNLWIAGEDASGSFTNLPSTWIPGKRIRLEGFSDTTYDTPAGSAAILDIKTHGRREGLQRSFRVRCTWTFAAPDNSYSTFVLNGFNWGPDGGPVANWSNTGTCTLDRIFDSGVTIPVDDPAGVYVARIVPNTIPGAGNITQNITGLTVGYQYRVWATVAQPYHPSGGFFTDIQIDCGGGSVQSSAGSRGRYEQVTFLFTASSTSHLLTISATNNTGSAADTVLVHHIFLYEADDAPPSGIEPGGGQAFGLESLFEYDGVKDTFDNVWDDMIDVLSTCRAVPMRDGKKLRFKYEYPRSPVGLITWAATLDDRGRSTFEWGYSGDLADRPNDITVEFLDKELNYTRSSIPAVKDSELISQPRHRDVFVEGLARKSQAKRHGRFLLAVNRLLVRQGKFTTVAEALPYEPGDLVVLAHELFPWGDSGRVISATGGTVTLDHPTTLGSGITLRVESTANSGAGGAPINYTASVTSPPGTATTISHGAFTPPYTPQPEDQWVLYDSPFIANITSISLTDDMRRVVEWIEYDAEVFADDNLTEDVV